MDLICWHLITLALRAPCSALPLHGVGGKTRPCGSPKERSDSMKLKVFTNEDDTLLFWSITEPIPECRGFAIERKKNKEPAEFLPNRVGFESDVDLGDTDEGSGPGTRPSTEWPLQRFSWTDHDASTGDTVSYRVVPIVRDSSGELRQLLDQASDW